MLFRNLKLGSRGSVGGVGEGRGANFIQILAKNKTSAPHGNLDPVYFWGVLFDNDKWTPAIYVERDGKRWPHVVNVTCTVFQTINN